PQRQPDHSRRAAHHGVFALDLHLVPTSGWGKPARSLGAPAPRIILHHLLPNAAGPIIVRLTYGIPQAIFTEAVLSFIGLGVRPPQASAELCTLQCVCGGCYRRFCASSDSGWL